MAIDVSAMKFYGCSMKGVKVGAGQERLLEN